MTARGADSRVGRHARRLRRAGGGDPRRGAEQGRRMERTLRLATAAVICGMTMQHASAAVLGPTPATDDRAAWIGFCTGFYGEIARQATLDNNVLLFNRAQQSVASYRDEAFIQANRNAAGDPTAWLGRPWQKRGAEAAGGDFWDAGPLLDAPNTPSVRVNIVALRSRYASACDLMATQSQEFHGEAEKLRRWLESLPPPDKKKRRRASAMHRASA
jgi:hypothetical protein